MPPMKTPSRITRRASSWTFVMGGLLFVSVVAGCAGSLEPGRLPTEEERCAFQGGSFRGGLCHTRGGQ